jgi:hypothetical protein
MDRVLEFFQSVDLASFAESLIGFIDSADLCFVGLILGVLALLGSKMVAPYPALQSWGLRLGVAAFLLYGGYAAVTLGGLDTDNLPRVGLRALIAGGLTLVPIWTVLPVLAFVYGRLRLALAAFLIYGAYACISQGGLDPDQLPTIALRGLIATGLTLVVAWILQPVFDYAGRVLLPRPRQPLPDWSREGERRREELRTHLELDRPARLADDEHIIVSRRERARAAEAEALADAQRRRNRARLKAELLYTLYAPAIGDRFPRKLFEDFLSRYLGEQHAPEDVEEYSRQLEAILQQHAGPGPGQEHFGNVTELTKWFVSEQRRILALDLTEELKKSQLLGLNQRYNRLAEHLLEESTC